MMILDLNFDVDLNLFRDCLFDEDGFFWEEEILDGIGTVDGKEITGCQRVPKFEKICTCRPFFYHRGLERLSGTLLPQDSVDRSCCMRVNLQLGDSGVVVFVLIDEGVLLKEASHFGVGLIQEFIDSRTVLLPVLVEERGEVDHEWLLMFKSIKLE